VERPLKWVSEFRLQVQLLGLGWLLKGRIPGDEALNEQLLAVLRIVMPDSHRHLLNSEHLVDKAWWSIETCVGKLCRTRLPEIKRRLHGPQADKRPNEKVADYVTNCVDLYQEFMDAGGVVT
jgi:hypothetical protein